MLKKTFWILPLFFLMSCGTVESPSPTTTITNHTTTISTLLGGVVIEYVGDNPLILNIGEAYIDDYINIIYEGNADVRVYYYGDLDINQPGTYTMHYQVFFQAGAIIKELERTVIVRDLNPVFTIDDDLYVDDINQEIDYLQGITAKDYQENDLTDLIEVDDTQVRYWFPGLYTVSYQVTDSFGYTQTITRPVHVNLSLYYGYQSLNEGTAFFDNLAGKADLDIRYSAAMTQDDQLMIVGAPYYQTSGSVFIYDDSGNEMDQIDGSLFESDEPKILFGSSVQLTEDYLFVVAPEYITNNNKRGAVFCFQRNGNTIDKENYQIIVREDVDDYMSTSFGFEIETLNDILAVTSQRDASSQTQSKQTNIYQLNPNTNEFELKQVILPQLSDYYQYGHQLAMNEEYLAISCVTWDNRTDLIEVYKWNGSIYTYHHSYIKEGSGLLIDFGRNIEIYQHYMFVTQTDSKNQGPIFIYDLTKEETEEGFLTTVSSPNYHYKGGYAYSIAIDNELLYVISSDVLESGETSQGVYIYSIPELLNNNHTPLDAFSVEVQGTKSFGKTLDVYQGNIMIGSPNAMHSVYRSGQVDIYQYDSGNVTFLETKTVEEPNKNFELTIDGEIYEGKMSEFDSLDHVYRFVIDKEGYQFIYHLIIDSQAPILNDTSIYSQGSDVSIESNELIYFYQIEDEEIVELETPSKTLDFSFEQDGEINIEVFDIARNTTQLVIYIDNQAPEIISTKYDIGDMYQTIYPPTNNLYEFGEQFAYQDQLLVMQSPKDLSWHGTGFVPIYSLVGMDFEYSTQITQPSDLCISFGKYVAINQTHIFIVSSRTVEETTEEVIYLYDRTNLEMPVNTLILPDGTIEKMEVNQETLAVFLTDDSDTSIYFYDLTSEQLSMTTYQKRDAEVITDISLSNNLLAIGTDNQQVIILDVQTKESYTITNPDAFSFYGETVSLQNQTLVTAGLRCLYVYQLDIHPKLDAFETKILISESAGYIYDIHLDNRYVVSGAYEGLYIVDLNQTFQEETRYGTYVPNNLAGNDFIFSKNMVLFSVLNIDEYYTNIGAFGTLYLETFYHITVNDLTSDQAVYQVINGEYILLNNSNNIITNQSMVLYTKDLAGNESTSSFECDDLTIEFVNRNETIRESSYEIITNQIFDAYSMDGGVTYTEIEPTKTYLLEGLSDGVYQIYVRYQDTMISSHPLTLSVDITLPTLDFSFDSENQAYNDIVYYLSYTYPGVVPHQMLMYEHYYMFVYQNLTSLDDQYGDCIISIYDSTLNKHDPGYKTTLNVNLEENVWKNFFGAQVFIDGDLLIVSAPFLEITGTSEGSIYIYDLSKLQTEEDLLVQQITNTQALYFGRQIEAKDGKLFVYSIIQEGRYDEIHQIDMYQLNQTTNLYEYTQTINQEILSVDSYLHIEPEKKVKSLLYEQDRLIVLRDDSHIYLYDLSEELIVETMILDTCVDNFTFVDDLLVMHHFYAYNDLNETYTYQLYFYDLNDSDLMVDYIYETSYTLASLETMRGKRTSYEDLLYGSQSKLKIINNQWLYVGYNFTLYDISMLLDGFDLTDEIIPLFMHQLETNATFDTPYNIVSDVYFIDDDLFVTYNPNSSVRFYNYLYVVQYSNDTFAFDIDSNIPYVYEIYLDGELLEKTTNGVYSLEGVYTIIIYDEAGHKVIETYTQT